MNVIGERSEAQVNVVSLFGAREESIQIDPLEELLNEAGVVEEVCEAAPPIRAERRKLVREDHFPEQGILILDQQLEQLKENLSRMRFYLSDLDDLILK